MCFKPISEAPTPFFARARARAVATSCRTANPGAPSSWQLEVVPEGDAPAKAVVNWVDATGGVVSAALATLSCGRSSDVTSSATTCTNADSWGARLDPSTQSAQLWGPELSAVELGCRTLANGVTSCLQRSVVVP